MIFLAEKEPDNTEAWNILGKVFRKTLIWGFRVDIVEVWRKFFRVRMGIPSLNAGDQIKQKFYLHETGMDHPELFSMNLWNCSSYPCLPSQILVAFTLHLLCQPTPFITGNCCKLLLASAVFLDLGGSGIETLTRSFQPPGAIFWRTLEMCYWAPIKSYKISMLAKSPKQNYGGLVCKKAVRICLKITKK